MSEINLLKKLVEFNNEFNPRTTEDKDKKRTYETAYAIYEGRELTLNVFKSGMCPIKAAKGEGLKILTPKKMLHRLAIANTSEHLLNEI